MLLLLVFNKLNLLLDIITYLRPITKSAQIMTNIRSPFPDLRFIEGQTNRLKKRSEKLFTFSKTFENILQLFFSGGNNYRPHMMISIPKDLLSKWCHQRVWDGNMGDVLVFSG